jgi:hypothetical protein
MYMKQQDRFLLYLLVLIFATSCISSGNKNSESAKRNTAYPVHTSTAQTIATPNLGYPESLIVTTTIPLSDNEKAIYDLLARYGWTINQKISTHTEALPETFQHEPGDFPYAIYWAYNNEFSKEIGLDIVPYLGQTVQAKLYQLNELLPEEFRPYTKARAVVLTLDGDIIGAWIDKGRHYGFACSLDRKQFEDIVKQKWDEWLVSSGVVNLSNELDNRLATMTPEEIIRIYYTALDEHDFRMLNAVRSRRAISHDLFVNNFDEEALFNHKEDATIKMWMENIKSAGLLGVTHLKDSHCLPVYAAEVNFQFVNPKIPSISEGTNLQFVVVNKEIEEIGWRIEEINSAPGVSQNLCYLK